MPLIVRNANTHLGGGFYVRDFTRSGTGAASKKQIDNTPTSSILSNLANLVANIAIPIKKNFPSIYISSGYRCPTLNSMVGGAGKSQHMLGQAMDFVCSDIVKCFHWIVNNLPFDQIIWEFGTNQKPAWIHVSYGPQHRRKILQAVKVNGKTKYLHKGYGKVSRSQTGVTGNFVSEPEIDWDPVLKAINEYTTSINGKDKEIHQKFIDKYLL